MWISLGDVADNFLVFAWSRPREEEEARSERAERVHRRARVQGVLERDADDEVGHPRRQHRATSRWTTSRCRPRTSSAAKARGSRSRCSRSIRAVTPSLPGATGLIRACRDASAAYALERQDLRRRDRPAPAGERNDRADGVGLSDVPAALAAIGLAQEHRPAEHARDRAREVVLDRRVRARRRRRRADSRRQRLLGRVSRSAASSGTARAR